MLRVCCVCWWPRSFRKLAGSVAREDKYVYELNSGWLDGVEWEKYVEDQFEVRMRCFWKICQMTRLSSQTGPASR